MTALAAENVAMRTFESLFMKAYTEPITNIMYASNLEVVKLILNFVIYQLEP